LIRTPAQRKLLTGPSPPAQEPSELAPDPAHALGQSPPRQSMKTRQSACRLRSRWRRSVLPQPEFPPTARNTDLKPTPACPSMAGPRSPSHQCPRSCLPTKHQKPPENDCPESDADPPRSARTADWVFVPVGCPKWQTLLH